MPVRQWIFRVKHIIENIEHIQEFVHGMSYEEFEADLRTQLAVNSCFGIIGEAVKYIPEDVQRHWTDIPWREMRRMRNYLVHEYDSIELDVVWNTIQHELPVILPMLKSLLRGID